KDWLDVQLRLNMTVFDGQLKPSEPFFKLLRDYEDFMWLYHDQLPAYVRPKFREWLRLAFQSPSQKLLIRPTLTSLTVATALLILSHVPTWAGDTVDVSPLKNQQATSLVDAKGQSSSSLLMLTTLGMKMESLGLEKWNG